MEYEILAHGVVIVTGDSPTYLKHWTENRFRNLRGDVIVKWEPIQGGELMLTWKARRGPESKEYRTSGYRLAVKA